MFHWLMSFSFNYKMDIIKKYLRPLFLCINKLLSNAISLPRGRDDVQLQLFGLS